MHILLVEDDIDMSRALVRALERRGFQVTHCGDGISALSHIKDGIGDLVVLDLNIPGLDGLHLLQRIRSQDIRSLKQKCPIIGSKIANIPPHRK